MATKAECEATNGSFLDDKATCPLEFSEQEYVGTEMVHAFLGEDATKEKEGLSDPKKCFDAVIGAARKGEPEVSEDSIPASTVHTVSIIGDDHEGNRVGCKFRIYTGVYQEETPYILHDYPDWIVSCVNMSAASCAEVEKLLEKSEFGKVFTHQ